MIYYIEIGGGMIAVGFTFLLIGSAIEETYRKLTKRSVNMDTRER